MKNLKFVGSIAETVVETGVGLAAGFGAQTIVASALNMLAPVSPLEGPVVKGSVFLAKWVVVTATGCAASSAVHEAIETVKTVVKDGKEAYDALKNKEVVEA